MSKISDFLESIDPNSFKYVFSAGGMTLLTSKEYDFRLNQIHDLTLENKKLKEKITNLEKGIYIEEGDYINGDKVTYITKDMFIKGQIDIFTDNVKITDFGDREVVGYRIRKKDK